jgi:RHS repeat-associated protein
MDRLQEAFTSDDCASGYDSEVGTGPYEFWYEYNAAGNLLEVLDTQAGTVLADYDYGDTGVNAGTNAAHNWDPNPGSAVAISYDRSGNMTSWGGDTLEWDADNRLRFYDKATGADTSMVYDADGNRVARITGTTVTTYIGDLYESDGTTTTAYYPFAGETVSYRQATASSELRYYLTADHLGSTTTVVESTDLANPVDQYYYPFGQPRTTWTINTDRAYTGQISDQDQTGLYDYNARYYHPALHRFISADTIVPDPANPQAHNRYSYVANNPTTFTDPSGHGWIRDIASGFGPVIVNVAVKTLNVVIKAPSWAQARIYKLAASGAALLDKGRETVGHVAAEGVNLATEWTLNKLNMSEGVGAAKGLGALDDASSAAFRAANNVSDFTVGLKHQPWASGGWNRFAVGVDQSAVIREALTSNTATFRPNYVGGVLSEDSFRVVTDLGQVIGTNGETAIRVVVGNDGTIWTAFPVKP